MGVFARAGGVSTLDSTYNFRSFLSQRAPTSVVTSSREGANLDSILQVQRECSNLVSLANNTCDVTSCSSSSSSNSVNKNNNGSNGSQRSHVATPVSHNRKTSSLFRRTQFVPVASALQMVPPIPTSSLKNNNSQHLCSAPSKYLQHL